MDALVTRCRKVAEKGGCLVVCGGVSLNGRLREQLSEMACSTGTKLMLAEPGYCTDNAAMIAGLAGAGGGVRGDQALSLDACPSLSF